MNKFLTPFMCVLCCSGLLSVVVPTSKDNCGTTDRLDLASPSTAEFQIVVRVPAAPLLGRPSDQGPAEIQISASELAASRHIDIASFNVVRCDPDTGDALSEALPFRWYDDAIPYEFPECEQNASNTDGLALDFVTRPRWGDYYNLLGEGQSGRLVWLHTQDGARPSYYRISLRLLSPGQIPQHMAPRGFVGDGSHRCAPLGGSTTGMIHSRVGVSDWNDDRLVDLLIGGARGGVLFYANHGSRSAPQFLHGQLVFTADHKPLDVGWSAAPLAVDWDGDGLTDLLCGAERNRILYFRNTATNRDPKLVNQGFLQADGQPIVLPTEPVPEGGGVFTMDYYPVLDVCDWNGDGRRDLLAGGYITGRVFFFENIGTEPGGRPRLAFRGPLISDGEPLDVGWAAAPCAADFDDDGDLDLICGNMPTTAGGGDSASSEHFLRYYENVGTPTAPRLMERGVPKTGNFPNSALGTPRAVDWNGDELLDLVVSAGENVYLFENVGTRRAPKFAAHARPIPSEWGSAPLPTWGIQFLDWNGDGSPDILSGLAIFRNKGGGDYEALSLLPPGNRIEHPPPRGDGWIFTQLADLDGDGQRDLLFGTHEGTIFLHRNTGGQPPRFDEAGERLLLENATPLKVGPTADQSLDFDVLQGARTTFSVADFDGDGMLDIAVGDTYGKLRHFRNVGTAKQPRFCPPTEIGDLKIRMVPYAADWDGDGLTDIVGSAANGTVSYFRNLGDGRFAPSETIVMPAVPYSPSVAVVDWNGDSDADLIVATAYGYFCWFERSFLERGYARAVVVETKGK